MKSILSFSLLFVLSASILSAMDGSGSDGSGYDSGSGVDAKTPRTSKRRRRSADQEIAEQANRTVSGALDVVHEVSDEEDGSPLVLKRTGGVGDVVPVSPTHTPAPRVLRAKKMRGPDDVSVETLDPRVEALANLVDTLTDAIASGEFDNRQVLDVLEEVFNAVGGEKGCDLNGLARDVFSQNAKKIAECREQLEKGQSGSDADDESEEEGDVKPSSKTTPAPLSCCARAKGRLGGFCSGLKYKLAGLMTHLSVRGVLSAAVVAGLVARLVQHDPAVAGIFARQ